MYVLETGTLDCVMIIEGRDKPQFIKTIAEGEGFGELALFYNEPRAATITAKSSYTIWKLDNNTFTFIVKDSAIKKREKYETFL